jgi:hypothetical protein
MKEAFYGEEIPFQYNLFPEETLVEGRWVSDPYRRWKSDCEALRSFAEFLQPDHFGADQLREVLLELLEDYDDR